ncbi:MAG: molybdopterin molybdenumtransferase MoeA [Candidatus Xenobia bacterium]
MLSVSQALERILSQVVPLEPRSHPLSQSLGLVLAQEVVSREAHPPFDNSAVDGFAVRSAEVAAGTWLELVGSIPAGSVPDFELGPGQAAAIMTGAMLCPGADACAMVEDSERQGGSVRFTRSVRPGENVRRRGEHLQPGQVVLRPGHRLRPADLGLAASLGYPELLGFPRARVAIVSTGSELVPPGQPLGPGQIRDSNSYALEAQVRACGGEPVRLGPVADDRDALERTLRQALGQADVLVTSAGVSVGEHDHVRDLIAQLGGELSFWRIKMRPGKPLAFGLAGSTPMFGLPGNPVSSMVTFELFVRPALELMMGRSPQEGRKQTARLAHEVTKKPGLTTFLRCRLESTGAAFLATATGDQGSHILRSMVEADALAVLPEELERLEAGHEVEVLPLHS